MANREQTPIGDNVSIPADESREYAHVAGATEWVSLVELVAETAGVLEAKVYVDDKRADERLEIPRRPDDGSDSPKEDSASTNPKAYPTTVSNVVGDTRFTTAIKLEKDDRLVFELNNSDPDNAQAVRLKAMTASTVRATFMGAE